MSIFKLDLPIHEKMILLLIREMSAAHDFVFPSYDTIAKLCSMSRRKVIYAVKHLVEMGLLEKEFRTKEVQGKSSQTSNSYKVSAPDALVCSEKCAPDAPYNSNSLNKQEDDDIYTSSPEFESEIARHKIPQYIRDRILREVSSIHTFSSDAIRRTFKKAMLRQRYGSGLFNFAKWFATTLRNEQFYLDQQSLRHAN